MSFVISMLFLFHAVSSASHSLKYFYTSSSGVPNFPEFVAVGLVDDVQMVHYDSNTRRAEPRQSWMSRVTHDDPQYWEDQTRVSVAHQQHHKVSLEVAKQRFNQTGGVHIFQRLYGCDWDEESNMVDGYDQYGYDGEDLLYFDLKTESWVTPNPQAFITKLKWDHDAWTPLTRPYLTHDCVNWLKKYLDYGKSSLQRTELPSVSLLQKTPSSPVSCHATGFYPDRAVMFWRKDGELLQRDVDHGETLPNHDGSFQMSIDLKPPSVPAEDWKKYECVFQLSGVDVVTSLDKAKIRTNWEDPTYTTVIVIVAVVVLVVVAAIGFFIYRKRNEKRPPSPVNTSDVQEQLMKVTVNTVDG